MWENKLEHNSFRAMKERCYSKRNSAYKNYGKRGIRVCARWMLSGGEGFRNFLKDVGKRPGENYTLERIDNNRGYSKVNCRWATRGEQVRNSRANIKITVNGKTKILKDWCRELHLSYGTMIDRITNRGLPAKKALLMPIKMAQSSMPRKHFIE